MAQDDNIRDSKPEPIGTIAGYTLISKLGQGSTGAVFKAKQISMDRYVALKVLSPKIAQNRPDFMERFIREARVSARLDHPNLVRGIEVGQDPNNGLRFFAMELVEGPNVRQILKKKGKLGEVDALKITRGIAMALSCAQKHGIVHRDVKPENILINKRGEPQLADLGLAKAIAEDGSADPAPADDLSGPRVDASLTQYGKSLGTPCYMAPEQARGANHLVDIRADIYALGATLFHMLTGHPPYKAQGASETARLHLEAPVPDVQAYQPDISDATAQLVQRMMQKDPKDRFQKADEVIQQVDLILFEVHGAPMDPSASPSQNKPPQKQARIGALEKWIFPFLKMKRAVAPHLFSFGLGALCMAALMLLFHGLMSGADEPARTAGVSSATHQAPPLPPHKKPGARTPDTNATRPQPVSSNQTGATPTKPDNAASRTPSSETPKALPADAGGVTKTAKPGRTSADDEHALTDKDPRSATPLAEQALLKKARALWTTPLQERNVQEAYARLQQLADRDKLSPDRLAILLTELTTDIKKEHRAWVQALNALLDEKKTTSVSTMLDTIRWPTPTTDLDLNAEKAELETIRKQWATLAFSSSSDNQASTSSEQAPNPGAAGKEALPKREADKRLKLGGIATLDLVYIPAGSFKRPATTADGGEAHMVISMPFYIGKYEVTQAQYLEVMGENPSFALHPFRPVEQVSWKEASQFCMKLGQRLKCSVDLPTEAQWTYACAAGNPHAGLTAEDSAFASASSWHAENAKGRTQRVGLKVPNPWGLFDALGNVHEWCRDAFEPIMKGKQIDPEGPSSGMLKVAKGGGIDSKIEELNPCFRFKLGLHEKRRDLGFRIVIPLDAKGEMRAGR